MIGELNANFNEKKKEFYFFKKIKFIYFQIILNKLFII
jgi:hypothetical protein